jgi:hypothetical protein
MAPSAAEPGGQKGPDELHCEPRADNCEQPFSRENPK